MFCCIFRLPIDAGATTSIPSYHQACVPFFQSLPGGSSMNPLDIVTAQNVRIGMQPAGMAERVVAAFIDYFILAVYLTIAIPTLINLTDGFIWREVWIVSFVPYFIYFPLMEIAFNGQSLGKRLMKLKVVRLDGTQPTIGDYLIRWLFRFVEIEMTLTTVGMTALFINKKGQRLGDMAAKTALIRIQPTVTLQDTVLQDVVSDYQPHFKEAHLLEDEDIQLVREVLNTLKKPRSKDAAVAAATQLQGILENKMGVAPGMEATPFLTTVLKDYNAIKG